MNNGEWKQRNRAKKWYRVRFGNGTRNDICYVLQRCNTLFRYVGRMWHLGRLYDGRKFTVVWWGEDGGK